jgi:putative membrane protein
MGFDLSALPAMSPEIQAFATGFPTTLLHAGVTFLLLILGCVLYVLLSPHREISQIREGNTAASISFGGLILALALPLCMSLNAATSLVEIAIWGLAVVVVQLLAFWIVDVLLTGLPGRVREGDVAAAGLLVAARLAVSMILAAAVAG